MLLSWMGYTALFTAFVAVVAIAADQLAAIWSSPRRFVWVGALAFSLLIPALLPFRPAPVRPAAPAATEGFRVTFDGATAVAPSTASPATFQPHSTPTVDWERVALAVWIGLSLLLLGRFARDFARIHRIKRAWRAAEVDGHQVLVGENVGPAVVGAMRSSIVLPSWAMNLDADERALMLRHEAEHIRAGDPRLLMTAAIALALVPWNPALWLIVRRLRLAVEIDCDTRVMRAVNRPREYGLLLIAVGARQSNSLPFAASLAEDRPLLERRILAMTSSRPSRPIVASLPFIALASLAITAAAQTPAPPPVPAKAPKPVKSPAPATPPTAAKTAPATASPMTLIADTLSFAMSDSPAHETIAPDDSRERRAMVEREMVRASAMAGNKGTIAAKAIGQVPTDTILIWIALHHPEVIRGTGVENRVTIVVDENEHYVISGAEKGPFTSATTLDRKDIESVEVLKGTAAADVYGAGAEKGVIVVKTKSDSMVTDADRERAVTAIRLVQEKAMAVAKGNQPLFIVDGVVVDPSVMGVKRSPIEGMGISPDAIESIDVLKFAAGRLTPDPLGVIVVKLKSKAQITLRPPGSLR